MSNAGAFLKDQANLPQEVNMHDRLADIATAQKAKFQNKQWKFQWLGKPQVVREKSKVSSSSPISGQVLSRPA
jgi:hypothetical protein